MVVKTFRGLLADEDEDHIRLSTIQGKVGYRIIKFSILPTEPGDNNQESTVKIWKTSQSTIDDNIDFTDSDLLAAGIYAASNNFNYQYTLPVIIFDNEVFNQDIYVTHKDSQAGKLNYYIELEVVPLDDAGAEYTTLKDMRSTGT